MLDAIVSIGHRLSYLRVIFGNHYIIVDLPELEAVYLGEEAFTYCHSTVFESD